MPKIKIINKESKDSLGTIQRIVHEGDIRKTYLHNEKNKTNFFTIIKEKEIENKFVILSKLEIGEKYNTFFKYDISGEVIYERRFNKIKKTTSKKELFIKNENGSIFIDEYNEQKSLKFNLNNKNVRNK